MAGGQTRARARAAVTAALAALAVAAALPSAAGAAGMTTHAWMADVAIDEVADPHLRALLRAQRATLLSGASYPDAGYYLGGVHPGADFGEITHWEQFVNAYVERIRSKPGCGGTLPDPRGPCAALVAHLMGVAAHGLGDETWDWMFEPRMPDHGEHPHDRHRVDDLPGWAELGSLQAPLLALDDATVGDDSHPLFGILNSPEYNMDVVAIADHGRVWFDSLPPPVDDLLAVYRAIGRDDVTADGILLAWAGITGILAAERASIAEAAWVRRDMPWSAANMTTSTGGVLHSAGMIAGYYEALWRKLTGDGHPAPRVVGTAPPDGTTDVPTDWAGARTSAGPHGDGDKRIIAVLSNGLDYDGPRHRPGAIRLYDEHGDEVAARAGFPQAGPYGGPGVHSIAFFPAGDLEPCTTYTAEVTTALADHAGATLAAPHRWHFTTAGCP